MPFVSADAHASAILVARPASASVLVVNAGWTIDVSLRRSERLGGSIETLRLTARASSA
ncbi:hypothetical protein [Thermaurantiacus tibetensis]|uniref:hypothetical protein n=1 Tax=Thermaurantiacus tibetensis TaxID=2759035 RepID=UPI00188F886F|nr:hypothetical protein [Thermaurantiacus tibetensis]